MALIIPKYNAYLPYAFILLVQFSFLDYNALMDPFCVCVCVCVFCKLQISVYPNENDNIWHKSQHNFFQLAWWHSNFIRINLNFRTWSFMKVFNFEVWNRSRLYLQRFNMCIFTLVLWNFNYSFKIIWQLVSRQCQLIPSLSPYVVQTFLLYNLLHYVSLIRLNIWRNRLLTTTFISC